MNSLKEKLHGGVAIVTTVETCATTRDGTIAFDIPAGARLHWVPGDFAWTVIALPLGTVKQGSALALALAAGKVIITFDEVNVTPYQVAQQYLQDAREGGDPAVRPAMTTAGSLSDYDT